MEYIKPEIYVYDERVLEEIAFFAGPGCGPPFSQCPNRQKKHSHD